MIYGSTSSIAANTQIDDIMNIQVIDKQGDNYRLIIYELDCLFIPFELFTTGLFPVKRTTVNGSLGWYVKRKFVSYNKVKKAISEWRQLKV